MRFPYKKPERNIPAPVEAKPEDVTSLCRCLHAVGEHIDGKGHCRNADDGKQCQCAEFRLLQGARKIEVPLLESPAFKPRITWWSQSIWRTLLRRLIGLDEDVAKGELFEKLVVSNTIHQAQMMEGLRRDFDESNRVQNPVNDAVVELQERLAFYEKHNDGLQPTYRKLMRLRTERQIARERAEAAAARLAAKKELQGHARPGELLDCPECGTDEPAENCKVCHGSGVIPNPEYEPPTEENHGDSSESEGAATGPQLVEG